MVGIFFGTSGVSTSAGGVEAVLVVESQAWEKIDAVVESADSSEPEPVRRAEDGGTVGESASPESKDSAGSAARSLLRSLFCFLLGLSSGGDGEGEAAGEAVGDRRGRFADMATGPGIYT
jgi:hypothetical protein